MAVNPYTRLQNQFQYKPYDPTMGMWAGQMKQRRADSNMKNFGDFYNDILDKNAFGVHDKNYLDGVQKEVEAFNDSLDGKDLSSPTTTRDIWKFRSKIMQDPGLKQVEAGYKKYQDAQKVRQQMEIAGTPAANLYAYDQSLQSTASQDLGDWSANTLNDQMSKFQDPQKRFESMINNVMQEGQLDQLDENGDPLSSTSYDAESGTWRITEAKKGIVEDKLKDIFYSEEGVNSVMNSPEGKQIQLQAQYGLANGQYQSLDEGLEQEYDNYASNAIRERTGFSINTKNLNYFDKKDGGDGDKEGVDRTWDSQGVSQTRAHFDSTESFVEKQAENETKLGELRKASEVAKLSGDYRGAANLDREADLLQDKINKADDLMNIHKQAFLKSQPAIEAGYDKIVKPELTEFTQSKFKSDNSSEKIVTDIEYTKEELQFIDNLIQEETKKGYEPGGPQRKPSGYNNNPGVRVNYKLEKLGVKVPDETAEYVKAYKEYFAQKEEMDDDFDTWIENGEGITDTEYHLGPETKDRSMQNNVTKIMNSGEFEPNDYDMNFVSDTEGDLGTWYHFNSPSETKRLNFMRGKYADDNKKFLHDLDPEGKWKFNGITSANKLYDGSLLAVYEESDGTEHEVRLTPKRKGTDRRTGLYNNVAEYFGIAGQGAVAEGDVYEVPATADGTNLANYNDKLGQRFDEGDKLFHTTKANGNSAYGIEVEGKRVTNSTYLERFKGKPEQKRNYFKDVMWDALEDGSPLTRRESDLLADAMSISKDPKYLQTVIDNINANHEGDTPIDMDGILNLTATVLQEPYNFSTKSEAINFGASKKKVEKVRNSQNNSVPLSGVEEIEVKEVETKKVTPSPTQVKTPVVEEKVTKPLPPAVKAEVKKEVKTVVNKPAATPITNDEVNIVAADSKGAKKAAVEQIAKVDKQGIRNPLYFANNYLGISEHDPKQQGIIKGFINRAVGQNWIKKNSEVELDSRAWCASFVDSILKEGGWGQLGDTASFDRVRAKEYANIGTPVDSITSARPGDLLVVTNKKTGANHVGFYGGKHEGNITILGGNQNDMVNLKYLDTDSVNIKVRRIKNVETMPESELAIIYKSEYFDKESLTATR